MNDFLQDLRYGFRVLLKARGFTAVAVVTLALGIGANTAMFSIVNGVLLRSLPFPESDRLMVIYSSAPQFERMSSSYPNFLDWQQRSRSFARMAAIRDDNFNLTGQRQPERVRVALVSSTFFPIFGLRPVLGRTFTADDDRRNAGPVIVLGTAYWKQRFGGEPGILGRTLVLNGVAYTVIGVAPGDIAVRRNIEAFLPIGGSREEIFWDRGVSMGMVAVGRLAPGVTEQQAQGEMTAIARGLARQFPKQNKDKGIALVPMRDDLVGDVRSPLLIMLGAVAFVLLIACANVANLLMARAASRRREFAIRAALGAGRARVVRQVLTEGALLALAGACVGLVLARGIMAVFLARVAGDLPAHAVVTVDATVLAFTAALAAAASLLFAAAPAFHSARYSTSETLKEGARGSTSRRGIQRGLVTAEIALALLLTVAAGLMVRTMWRLWQVDPGFEPRNVLTVASAGIPSNTMDPQDLRAGYAELEDRIRRLPGVEAVSVLAGSIPMTGDSELPFWVVGRPHPTEQSQMPWALFYCVSSGYQKAFGLRMVRGRFIEQTDTENAPYVVVIDDELARTVFPGQDPIGQQLHFDIVNADYRIVGIVGHVNHWGLDRDGTQRIRSQMYFPFRQLPDAIMPVAASQAAWVLRTPVASGIMAAQIKQVIFQFKADMTTFNSRTMEEIISDSLSQKRLIRLLLGAFALVALVLAAVGVYGVMSQLVLQRTHDIGVRMALGASPRAMLTMVLGDAMTMASAGIVAGALAALAATRLMQSMLFGVNAGDPLTFIAVSLILGAVALLASYVPARRATSVDPLVVLRYE